tara:strand:- start:7040 stop:8857 length:1818 start_codon:yes stop_codon:yes gene_type:complete
MTNHVNYIKSSLGLKEVKVKTSYKKLLSIHLQSNNPKNFSGFIKSLEKYIENIALIEVIVKIDDNDSQMNSLLEELVKNSKISIKYISSPLLGDFSDLWRSMNDILHICEKETYFIWNMNDEMRIPIKGWDNILTEYVDIFPDGLFRLRTSRFRHRNYTDTWECCFAPETSAITTKKLIDTCGNWNPTLGPDTFNQLVAYYFSYHDRFNGNKETRDIVINDFIFEGEGASIGDNKKDVAKRLFSTTSSWYKLVSYKTQLEASKRSQLIQAQIYKEKYFKESKEYNDIKIIQKNKNIIIILDEVELYRFPYKISRLKISISNFLKSLQYFKFGGGGENYMQNTIKNKKYRNLRRIIINSIELYFYSICLRLKLKKIYSLGRLYKLIRCNFKRGYIRKFSNYKDGLIGSLPKIIRKTIKEILSLPYKITMILIYFINSLVDIYLLLLKKLLILITFSSLPLKYFHRIFFREIALYKNNTFFNYLLKIKRNYSYNFICRFDLLPRYNGNTDATHFFNKIDYLKLIPFLKSNNILLESSALKNYVEIIMLCKFYNINIEKIQENKETLSSVLLNLEYIFNDFDQHRNNITQINYIFKAKFNYNLKIFLN